MSSNSSTCACDCSDALVLGKNLEASSCNCGWEVKFGYGVAFTLAIFEAKRLFMLLLEMIAEWQVIRFAGGLRPVVLTLLDIVVGLPASLVAVRTIRKCKVPQCCSKRKKILKCLFVIIATCTALNVATLVSIGLHISVKEETLVDIFNSSMRLYVDTLSYKYAIDEIQFVFQCCGHTSYTDWFLFDWQRVDYAPRDEMLSQSVLSDEEVRDRGVPFSCCSLHSMNPCVHVQMIEADVSTINSNGCVQVISPVLLRIVVIAYVMTSTLVVTQALLAFLIARIIAKLLERKAFAACSLSSVDGSTCVLVNLTSSSGRKYDSLTTYEQRSSEKTKRSAQSQRIKIKRSSTRRDSSAWRKKTQFDSSRSSFSPRESPNMDTCEAAKIKPSAHEEHRISKKRFSNQRMR